MESELFHTADYAGQEKVVKILENVFSGCSLNIEQHYDDYDLDIYMTATTKNNIVHKYVYECKDREYPHTAFKTGKNAGWMISPYKYNKLLEASKRGYKPIYFNTFSDNTFCAWNILDCPYTNGTVDAAVYTVKPSEVVTKHSYFFHIKDDENGNKMYSFSGRTN